MLFKLADDTPRFEVFRLLNEELLHFLAQSVSANTFGRVLFTQGAVGQACWGNFPTREKFEVLFNALQITENNSKQQLFEVMRDNQNFQVFFENPKRNLFDFMNEDCRKVLKSLCTHLYCSTKDLAPIVTASGGTNITGHFNAYRAQAVNGNICKACGMKELAAFRAEIPEGDQWRADYDHQLCKSKYPIFAVHPDNLIPLCDVCNQDAKKAKDLFKHKNGTERLAFYPFNEEVMDFIGIEINSLRDPEPTIKVIWNTQDDVLLDKINTWDEIYEIRNRVEGKLRSLEAIIEDEINPVDREHLKQRIIDEARPKTPDTLKRKEWVFWYQKLFCALEQIDTSPFIAKWEFVQQQAIDGAEFILEQT